MKKTSLLNMVEKKPASAAPVAPAGQSGGHPVESAGGPVDADTATAGDDVERHRVITRLNLEAVEALDSIRHELRRKTGRPVPLQALMEEAVTDLLRKYDRSAVVLPAPAKRGR